MVQFWSVDLTSTQASMTVYLLASAFILLFWFKILPWIDGESKIKSVTEGGWVGYYLVKRKKHFKVRLWLEAITLVIFVTYFLSLVIYPPAWSKGIEYFVFVARQTPNGAHITSYALVCVTVILGFLKWNDVLKALVFGGSMAFYHEGLWFPFYYLSNWGSVNFPLDFAFAVWITSIGLVAVKKYHFRIWKTGLAMFFGYLLSWFASGFHVTVKNVSSVGLFYQTPYYGQFYAEANETVSWILMFSVFAVSLIWLNGKGWKVREIFSWN